MAEFLLFGVSTLAHDNGVVHDDTQDEDETENTDQVQAGIDKRRVNHCHGTQEANRYSQHDPKGQFNFQEQGQDNEDQQRTYRQVLQHHAQATFQIVGRVIPYIQGYALG